MGTLRARTWAKVHPPCPGGQASASLLAEVSRADSRTLAFCKSWSRTASPFLTSREPAWAVSCAPLMRIIETCRTLRFRDIARWRVSRLGLASNQRLENLIERVFESRRFEDLRIPLAVVATDLTSGEPVVFTQGNLVDAIRASCAFPGLFEPVVIGTRCLADGGLVAPVPTRAA